MKTILLYFTPIVIIYLLVSYLTYRVRRITFKTSLRYWQYISWSLDTIDEALLHLIITLTLYLVMYIILY